MVARDGPVAAGLAAAAKRTIDMVEGHALIALVVTTPASHALPLPPHTRPSAPPHRPARPSLRATPVPLTSQ